MDISLAALRRNPSFPYVAPFVLFLFLLGVGQLAFLPESVDAAARVLLLMAALFFWSREAIDLKVSHWLWTVLLGCLVFIVWIGPDLLWPQYRTHWLFHNSLTWPARSSVSALGQSDPAVLILRAARAVIIVPVVEELFWRAWLMRWLISSDFRSVPLGAYAARPFWTTAFLFASEHGPYWDVGMAAGILYNWWMIRTKSLGDLILAHAVTNALLCAYVIRYHKWDYWM